MPYGNYPAEDKITFLKELILKDTVFLLGNRYWTSRSSQFPRRDKPPVKAVVIACNTATSYGLEDIHDAMGRWNIPIYTVGVVAAGADGAVESLLDAEAPGAVAVMATVGTCKSDGYVREITRSSSRSENRSSRDYSTGLPRAGQCGRREPGVHRVSRFRGLRNLPGPGRGPPLRPDRRVLDSSITGLKKPASLATPRTPGRGA